MQLVDSHCHLNFAPLNAQLPQVLQNAYASQVAYMLCVSVNWEDFPQVLALAQTHAQVFASVGVHPNERGGMEPSVEALLQQAQTTEVVAIGETGLDYYRSEGDLEWQKARFRRHIAAACACGKPLIVHTRQAAADTLQILKDEGAARVGGVMHCFSEDWETARQALDLGFYISFSGIVTFKNAAVLRTVAERVPADRLLVETDSPYLAPVPHRGHTNEPAYVRYVAECVANLRQTSLEGLAQQTTENFFTLFKAARPQSGLA